MKTAPVSPTSKTEAKSREFSAAKTWMPTPCLMFDYATAESWCGQSATYVGDQVKKMEKRIKKGIDYPWANSHVYITDIYGKACLTVLFHQDTISLWEYRTGYWIGDWILDQMEKRHLREIIDKVSSGWHKCNKCAKWVKSEKAKSYSFAGMVCKKCFDPACHQPPDTSGS